MNLLVDAHRLDGYLLAIAELKGDGTHFSCVYLGEVAPVDAGPALCIVFKLGSDGLRLQPAQPMERSGFPASLEHWILNRVRPMSTADESALDRRLVDGLHAELVDIFGKTPQWLEVAHLPPHPHVHLGAFWNFYVFGVDGGSCAIHCAWDD